MAFKFIRISALTIAAIISFTATAYAGGFGNNFGGPLGGVSAKALANNYSHLSSPSGQVRTKNYAKVGQYSINNGEILKGFAEAGNKVQVIVNGQDCGQCNNGRVRVNQKSTARTKIHIKGKNMLAKAYAQNSLKLYVDGQLSFENEEYAYAMGRFTPLGTQMKAGATSHNKLEAKGLVRLNTGQIVVSTGQVGK